MKEKKKQNRTKNISIFLHTQNLVTNDRQTDSFYVDDCRLHWIPMIYWHRLRHRNYIMSYTAVLKIKWKKKLKKMRDIELCKMKLICVNP